MPTYTANLMGRPEIQTIQKARTIDLDDDDDHVIGASEFGGRIKVWLYPVTPGDAVSAAIHVGFQSAAYGTFGNHYILDCPAGDPQSEVLELYGGPDVSLIVHAQRVGANSGTMCMAPCDEHASTSKGLCALVNTEQNLDEDDATYIDIDAPENVAANDLLVALIGVNDTGTVVPTHPGSGWTWMGGSESEAKINEAAASPCLRAAYKLAGGITGGNFSAVTAQDTSGNVSHAYTYEGGTQVELETDAAHGLIVGASVTVAGTTSYNGTWKVFKVTSTTKFVILDPYVADESGTWATDRVRFTVSAAHPMVAGDYVKIDQETGTDYDGTYLIVAVSDSTHFDIDHEDDGDKTGTWRTVYRWVDPAASPSGKTWGAVVIALRAEEASNLMNYGIMSAPYTQKIRNKGTGATTDLGWDPDLGFYIGVASEGADPESAFFSATRKTPIAVLLFVGASGEDVAGVTWMNGSLAPGATGETSDGLMNFEGNGMCSIGFATQYRAGLSYLWTGFTASAAAVNYQWGTYFLCIFT